MSEIGEELRLLYTTCITEIAFFKQQQWRVTNYALLIYVAIVGIPKFLGSLNRFEYILLFVFAAVVFGVGYWVLGLLSDSIKIRLEQQTNVRNRFTTNFKLTWRYHEPKDNTLITIDTKPKSRDETLFVRKWNGSWRVKRWNPWSVQYYGERLSTSHAMVSHFFLRLAQHSMAACGRLGSIPSSS